MKQLIATTIYTVKLLRRDKVFFPAILFGGLLGVFAAMASAWTIDDYNRVLYDFGLGGFHFIGAIVAVFWGAKTISDYKSDSSIELQLTAPISKSHWFLGKYLGLLFVLSVIGLGLMALWQVILLQYGYEMMQTRQVIPFLMFVLEWWILGAVAFFFASFATSTTSIFCTLVAWILGLTSQLFYTAMTSETGAFIKGSLGLLKKYWNFQRLNYSDFAVVGEFPSSAYIMSSVLFASCVIVLLVSLGAFVFNRRQIQ